MPTEAASLLALKLAIQHPRAVDLFRPQPKRLAQKLAAVGQAIDEIARRARRNDDLRRLPPTIGDHQGATETGRPIALIAQRLPDFQVAAVVSRGAAADGHVATGNLDRPVGGKANEAVGLEFKFQGKRLRPGQHVVGQDHLERELPRGAGLDMELGRRRLDVPVRRGGAIRKRPITARGSVLRISKSIAAIIVGTLSNDFGAKRVFSCHWVIVPSSPVRRVGRRWISIFDRAPLSNATATSATRPQRSRDRKWSPR